MSHRFNPELMRVAVLVFLLFPAFAEAQTAADQAGVARAFGRFVSFAHSDGVEATNDLVACPVENDDGQTVAGLCDMELAAHRVRVERLTNLARALFPPQPTALNPHYGTEEEQDGVFHLLLFRELESAELVLAAFMDIEGAYRLTDLDVEGGPNETQPPSSVTSALRRLLTAAEDETASVETFAARVVARGEDADREWKAPADPSREEERPFVEQSLAAIRTLMEASRGDYEIVSYQRERESEGEWHVLRVRFDTHEMEEHVSFSFLPVGDALLLGDIDRREVDQ